MNSVVRQVLLVTAIALGVDALAPAAAWAYLDPGTGSLVFQWIIAGVVGGAIALKMSWRRIAMLLRGKRGGDDVEPE